VIIEKLRTLLIVKYLTEGHKGCAPEAQRWWLTPIILAIMEIVIKLAPGK
jgi:hypothetical protein